MADNPEYINLDTIDDYQPEVTPGAAVKEVVGGLVKFGIGMAVLHKVSGSLAKAVFKTANKNAEHVAADILQKSGAGVAERLNLGSLLKGVVKSAGEATQVKNFGTSVWGQAGVGRRFTQSLSNAGTIASEVHRGAKSLDSQLRASKVIGAKHLANFGKMVYKSMPAYAAFYGLEKALSNEDNNRAWYNIPGHVGDFAKFTAQMAAFDGSLKGIGVAYKGVKGAFRGFVGKYLNTSVAPGLHDFLDKTLGTVRSGRGTVQRSPIQDAALKFNSTIKFGKAFAKNVSASMGDGLAKWWGNQSQRAFHAEPGKSLGSRGFWNATIDNALREAKKERRTYVSEKQKFHNNYQDISNRLTKLMEHAGGMEPGSIKGKLTDYKWKSGNVSKEFFEELLGTIKIMNTKAEAGFGPVTGRKLATAKDIMIKKGSKSYHAQLFNELRKHTSQANQAMVGQVESAFRNMYLGENIFKHSSGGIVDFSRFTPTHMWKSAVNAAMQATTFRLPFRMGQVKLLGEVANMMGKQGTNFDSFGKQESFYYKSMQDGHMVEHTGFGIDSKDNSLAGVLINGKLFTTNNVNGDLNLVKGVEGRFVNATPYSRFSYVSKTFAMQGGAMGEAVKRASNLEDEIAHVAGREMLGKLLSTGDRLATKYSLGMPPILTGMVRRAQRALGISKESNMIKAEVDALLGNSNEKVALGNLLNDVVGMGNAATKDMHLNLRDPKTLSLLAKMSQHDKVTNERFKFMRDYVMGDKSVSELIQHAEKHGLAADEEVGSIIRGYHDMGATHLEGTATIGRGFHARHLTREQELVRKMITDGMVGMGWGKSLPAEGGTFNLAKDLLKNSDYIKSLSHEQKNNLEMMSMSFDLQAIPHRFSGQRFAGAAPTSAVVKEALTILKRDHADKAEVLTRGLSLRPNKAGLSEVFDAAKSNEFYDVMAKKMAERVGGSKSPYTFIQKGESPFYMFNYFADKLMGMGNFFGFKYDAMEMASRGDMYIGLPKWLNPSQDKKMFVGTGGKAMFNRIKQGIGVMAALQAADAFTDGNPLFAGTMLKNGIYSAAADVSIKAGLAFHKASDVLGVTGVSKYMEGLLPYSTTSIPGAVIGGIMRGPLGIIPGAVANRVLSPLLPDFDKSYDEMKDIYSGRELVPVKKGRWWIFSRNSYEGEGVEYYRPHALARMRSQYKYTDTLYGSKLEALIYKPLPWLGINPIGHFLDKYHYERKHYWDRPYPSTAPAFDEIPIFGPAISAVIGGLPIIGKLKKSMHEDEIAHYYDKNDRGSSTFGELAESSMPIPGILEHTGYMVKATNVNSSARWQLRGGPSKPTNPYGMSTAIGEQAYNFTEAMGLPGFLAETVMGGHPFDSSVRYSTSKEMWSSKRAFWDLSLGDLGGTTEFFRRFVPREKSMWKKINPLRNRMPVWLPGGEENSYFVDFLSGDPFAKIAEGEIRLPGKAYTTLYHTNNSFPGRASGIGQDIGRIVKSMVGLESPEEMRSSEEEEGGTRLHRVIQKNLTAANVALKTEVLVYNPERDISGHIDALIRDPSQKTGERVLEIKTISGKKWGALKGPQQEHVSQINFYLHQTRDQVGTLLYVNRDDPSQVKTFDVRYSKKRFETDMSKIEKARKIAAGIVANGEGYEDGSAYSWLDRYRILSDVAPWSKECRDAGTIVRSQMRAGMLTEKEIADVQKIRTHRNTVMRKYDLYPTRFKNRVFNPDISYELMSTNENLKAAGEYSFAERAIGSLWERLLTANTPINTRFFNYRSPLEHYRQTRLYGTTFASWSKPKEDFLDPMFRTARGSEGPIEGAASFGLLGYLAGGTIGAGFLGGLAAAATGFGYGSVREAVGAQPWIPDTVKGERDLEKSFDAMKYARSMELYGITGDDDYLKEAEGTMWSARTKGYDVGMSTAMKALSNFEKPYFHAFAAETNPRERRRILQSVPRDVGMLLVKRWKDSSLSDAVVAEPNIPNPGVVNAYWPGLKSNEAFEDIKVKTIENSGYDSHDWGLGWYDQQRRMQNAPYAIEPLSNDKRNSIVDVDGIDINGMKVAITQVLAKFTRERVTVGVTAIPGDDSGTKLQVRITRDRMREISYLIRGY